MNPRFLFVLLFVFACPACGYRPARFADAPPIARIRDDAPIPVPPHREYRKKLHISDVYFRFALLDALDPTRFPEAGDINAHDEVPLSSWYWPVGVRHGVHTPPLSVQGPPVLPLVLQPGSHLASDGSVVVTDARGLRYELSQDPPDRPEMRTGAAAISSRLVRAFGLFTPEVHVISLRSTDLVTGDSARGFPSSRLRANVAEGRLAPGGRIRVSATRWPPGIDVGVTPAFGMRNDDPNDRVPHRDRRTLRALKVLGAWLAIDKIGPSKTRDVYVGRSPRGHLLHFVVGLEESLGARSVIPKTPTPRPREDLAGGPPVSFFSFGLWPSSDPTPTQTRWPAIGNYDVDVDPEAYAPSLPYAPIVRALPGDGYWAAKRIAAISESEIEDALEAARLSDGSARKELLRRILARRRRVVAYWFGQVTPCEVERVYGDRVVLRDEAIRFGVARASETTYLVSVIDESGEPLLGPRSVRLSSERFVVRIPESVTSGRDRVVIRLVAMRRKKAQPRHSDVHLIPTGGGSDQREPEWTTVHGGRRARRNAARSPLIGSGPAGRSFRWVGIRH